MISKFIAGAKRVLRLCVVKSGSSLALHVLASILRHLRGQWWDAWNLSSMCCAIGKTLRVLGCSWVPNKVPGSTFLDIASLSYIHQIRL
jgi:hypothetical protein